MNLNGSAAAEGKPGTCCQSGRPENIDFQNLIGSDHISPLAIPQGVPITQKMVDSFLWLQRLGF